LDDAFDPELFAKSLKTRQTVIKQLLLAGDVVVGVGNIYASEALFRAGIRPTTRAHRISKPRAFEATPSDSRSADGGSCSRRQQLARLQQCAWTKRLFPIAGHGV
jgi:formamidopyrimidine-DNA glycosylase